jgi:hypothetical protein
MKACSDGFKPDLVVAVLRGGCPVGLIVSDLYGVEVEALKIRHYHKWKRENHAKIIQPLQVKISGKRVFLVDDVADTGESLKLAIRHLQRLKAAQVKVGTLHVKPWSSFVPDYYVEQTDAWIVYPWETGEFSRGIRDEMLEKGKSRNEMLRALRKFRLKGKLLRMVLGF